MRKHVAQYMCFNIIQTPEMQKKKDISLMCWVFSAAV